MNRLLTTNEIDYVIFHLFQSLELSESLKSYFHYNLKSHSSKHLTKKIIFNLSSDEIKLDDLIWIDNIPILFPLSNNKSFYTIEKDNLIFHQDILKSAFYLLSGYQELNPEYKDKYNRFPYELSIQKKLGITEKPIVNYYFDIMKQGIDEFCKTNCIEFKNNNKVAEFKFFLTHDVDIVDTYNVYDLVYYIKVLLGITKSNLSIKLKLKKTWEYLLNFLFTRNNPNWDFDFLRNIEKENNLKSAFYFLPKGVKHQDAYYSFNEPRLKQLFKSLNNDSCEIGIHGSVRSAIDIEVLKSDILQLEQYSQQKVIGIRQHRLLFDINITPKLHESANLLYDTTLGFAEHEGFRNSYCHPFKLYNFDEDRPYNTWEIPLNVMDVTLFDYRAIKCTEAWVSILNIVNEISKFNGVFTLLWHNGYFDESLYPGIKNLYLDILKYISTLNAKSFNEKLLSN